MIIVMILSSVWVTPIKSYGQTEAEISSAEDVRNTETDHGTFKKSETDSVDDEECWNRTRILTFQRRKIQPTVITAQALQEQ